MPAKRPNFLVVVADDLGYSDLGCYGSEIKTPNLDRIAKEGIQFTDFHTAAMCSPTRSMILSGTDNHIAGGGCMSESRAGQYERWNVRGHEGFLNFDVAALPELLQDSSYLTLMSGKWHLGLRPDTNPAARGFDRSFALLPGCSNHWGYEPQFKDYKLGFFDNIPVLYTEDGKWREVEPNRQNSYKDGFYSTEYYTANLLRYLDDRQNILEQKEKPFFAYLPFAAPHWPLQCSAEDRETYRGMYDDGPDALRLQRLANLKKRGIVGEDVVPHDVVSFGMNEWKDMDTDERTKTCRAMEVYAGMVQCIDRNVGRVIDYLEKTGELDNTFILFMSDNGAEGAMEEAKPIMGRASLTDVISSHYNNSLNNMGNHDSFFWYGPRWAQAATAPSRLYKRYSTEGGILVPCVVRYPPLFQTSTQDSVVRAFATAMDIMPTILDLAGVKHPAVDFKGRDMAPYRDRKVFRMTGKSWVDYFSGSPRGQDEQGIYGDNFWFGWELHGMACLRKGKWKIVFMDTNHPTGTGRWELFDLEKDPGETKDLAKEMPDLVNQMTVLFDRYVESTGTVWGPPMSNKTKPFGWQVPEDSVGGNPQAQRERWPKDPALRGPSLNGIVKLPPGI